ncbi:N/A [soil metagenome]
MGQPRAIIECYEHLAALSGEMLVAARAGLWDQVASLEHLCLAKISELRVASAGIELDRAERDLRFQALRRILAADAEIRSIAEPQWARIGLAGQIAPGNGTTH